MRITCFDLDDLSIDWTYDHEFPIESSKALHHDIVIDNQGRAFIFKKHYNKGWYHYLYSYSADGKWQEYEVKGIDGLAVLDHKLGTNINGEIYLFATYTEKESNFKRRLDGDWYFALDNNLKEKTQLRSAWKAELLSNYKLFHKEVDDPESENLSNFYIKDVLGRQDGNLLIVMEQMSSSTDAIDGTSPVQYTYQ
ncbi:MAG: hypothetical protein AAGC47_07155 [Bacteroidota bacterium]